jgi:hypothetical protein
MAVQKKLVPFMLERRFEGVLSMAAVMESRTVSGYLRHLLERDWRRKGLIDQYGNVLIEESNDNASESRGDLAEVG